MTAKQAYTGKNYPRCERWDYIASSKEDREINSLNELRAAIEQSKKEFEKGERTLLQSTFFDQFQ